MSEASARQRIWTALSERIRRMGETPEESVARVLTFTIVALGLWLRARGFVYDEPAFWVDEATWAVMLMERPLVDLLIRPPGFMAVSKVFALIFGPTETALRLLPFLAAVAAALFAPALARRLFTGWTGRLLFVAVIALHPSATSFAKEFKPYSVSFTLHLALLLLALRYLATRRAKDLAWLLGVAVAGGLFAQDLVFAYPGLFLVVGYEAWRHQRRHLPAIGLSAAAIIGELVAQYVLIWSRLGQENTDFWANKYKVFHTERSGTYLEWLFTKYQGLAAFPGYQMKFWNARWLSDDAWHVATAVWVILHVVGIFSMFFRRRYREAVLVLLPIGVLWVFNLAGFWPFGVFRANLFLIGYSATIAAMAFERPSKRWRVATAVTPTLLLIVMPLFWFEHGWGPTKRALTYTSRFSELVVWLSEVDRKRIVEPEAILVDRRSCDLWRYYVEVHPTISKLRPTLERTFRAQCIDKDPRLAESVKRVQSQGRPIWLLFNVRTKTKMVLADAKQRAEVVVQRSVPGHTVLGLAPARKVSGHDERKRR